MSPSPPLHILPMAKSVPEGAGIFQLPSRQQSFVVGVLDTPVGQVPRVATKLTWQDRRGHYLVRWNIGRDSYTVEPGLYGIGQPDAEAPVLVTANYKLTFDLLRQTMGEQDCWLLVLDTKGVNVWCAAGKGSFGTEELVDRIKASRLHEIVTHGRLIVPQLGATGVNSWDVQKYAGFSVCYGPVMMTDLPRFLAAGAKATPGMRRKRFPFMERLILVPVEVMQGLRQGIPLMVFFFILAGWLADGSFVSAGLDYGLPPIIAIVAGVVAGNIITPLLLPWLPGRAFSVKGVFAGLLVMGLGIGLLDLHSGHYSGSVLSAFILLTLAVSSWLGMAFTGASTYTSLNGVKKEMLRGMPLQCAGFVGGVGLWLATFF